MLDSHLVIGEILKPQGVKGEVKVRPITCDPGRFADLKTVYFKRGEAFEARAMRFVRGDADAVYLIFQGVNDRDAAEKLRGELIYVDRAHAVQLPADAEFICDLIGCVARDDEGNEIGTLYEVMQPGAGDVYAFKGPRGDVLVPALKSVVLGVDVVKKEMLLSKARLKEVAVYEDE